MTHLLLVESWVGSMGVLLPRTIAELGVDFTFLTRHPDHYPRTLPDGSPHPLRQGRAVVTAETNDLAAAIEAARRIDSLAPIDGVLTSCDYYLPTVARIAAELGLAGPDQIAMETACDKSQTRAALDRHGAGGTRYATVRIDDPSSLRAAVEAVGFPLVIKPTDLCAGMFVRRAGDWAEIRAAIEALRGFETNARGQRRSPIVLIEEYLDGPEFSVESWIRRGRVHSVGVTDKRLGGLTGFVEQGHMYPATISDAQHQMLTAAAESAIEAVGLDHGVVHTELRLTSGGPRIIEINPRPAGNQITELIKLVTGTDLPRTAVELALDRLPTTGLHVDTPPLARPKSAAVRMLVPDQAGILANVHGTTDVMNHPAVVTASFKEAGHRTAASIDNNSYLGSLIAVSSDPVGAGSLADGLMSSLRVEYV